MPKDELPRFMKALDEQEDRLSMAVIKLLRYSGCLKGEVLTLKWNQVKLDEGRFFLPEAKNGKARSIILNAKAKEVLSWLNENKGKSEYVFPSRGKSKLEHLEDIRKPFSKVCLAAGIDGLRIHDLRHSFATIAVL